MHQNRITLQAFIVFLLLAISPLVFPFAAKAKERIIAFDVTAEVQEDSSLFITERIRVMIEHNAIKHGIYRVLPTSRKAEKGLGSSHSYDFTSITLNGKTAPYAKASHSGNIAVAIGSEKVKAPLGEHTYEIRYSVTSHVLFFKDRDEIYLNVTGNDWKLPIDSASFTLILPGGAEKILKTDAFTGQRGESGSDFVMEGKNIFRTTRPFAVGEGLTVAVAWEKGIVSQPNYIRIDWVADNREACVLGLLALPFLYFLIFRSRLNPKPKQAVIPLFSPPEGMSPGYVAALKDKTDTGRFLHADIMGAAVNGFLRVDAKSKKNIVLHRLAPEKKPKAWITQYCTRTVTWLCTPENPCDLRTRKGKIQAGTAHDFLESMYTKLQKDCWRGATLIRLGGWLLVATLACLMSLVVDYPEIAGEDRLNYPIVVALLYALGSCGFLMFRMARKKRRLLFYRVLLYMSAPVMLILGVGGIFGQMEADGFWASRHIMLFFVTAFFMGRLPNPARTPQSMEQYAQILGLEMYIRAAEKHRLAMINAPEDTVEKYEELLPYAIALNCADAWQKRFEKLLKDVNYSPDWVEHKLFGDDDALAAVNVATRSTAMSVAIAACVAANDSASRVTVSSGFSSSDSSSGGSSGGGSGGGGGGGW